MEQVEDDRFCFVCGDKNPDGLQLDWTLSEDEDVLRTTFTPGKQWQGWKDVVHGGIVATILDEIMVNHGVMTGTPMVSVELNVRYRNPGEINVPLEFEGSSNQLKGKLYEGRAECVQNDRTIAEAESKLMKVEADLRETWENE